MSPRAKRGVSSPWDRGPNAIGLGVTLILVHKVLWDQDLNSSVAEFILSYAEGLLRNDMVRFKLVTEAKSGITAGTTRVPVLDL